jgi:hypothetical protein
LDERSELCCRKPCRLIPDVLQHSVGQFTRERGINVTWRLRKADWPRAAGRPGFGRGPWRGLVCRRGEFVEDRAFGDWVLFGHRTLGSENLDRLIVDELVLAEEFYQISAGVRQYHVL